MGIIDSAFILWLDNFKFKYKQRHKMKKEKLSIVKISVKSFIPQLQPIEKQTLAGGTSGLRFFTNPALCEKTTNCGIDPLEFVNHCDYSIMI